MTPSKKQQFLDYLPAIFHKPQESVPGDDTELPPLLSPILEPFEEAFAEYDDLLSSLDRYIAPELTPAAEFLPWLATWVALLVDEEWDELTQRRLIGQAVELYRWRGTAVGLQRILALYTGLPAEAIEIDDFCWPGGMQIGVASRIGSIEQLEPCVALQRPVEVDTREYYTIDTETPASFPANHPVPPLADDSKLSLTYRAEKVERIDFEEEGVAIVFRRTDGTKEELRHRRPADISDSVQDRRRYCRRNERVDYHYIFPEGEGSGSPPEVYRGGAFLLGKIPLPYRFIVNIRTTYADKPETAEGLRFWAKIQKILDLEKPAHTAYYLMTLPEPTADVPCWMQIEECSSVGLDTIIG